MQVTSGLQHSDLTLGLWAFFSFYFDCTTDQESWVGHSKSWHNSSCPYSIFTACSELGQNSHKNSIVQIFVVFIFTHRTCMRNMRKLAPCENILLYSIYVPHKVVLFQLSNTEYLHLHSGQTPCTPLVLASSHIYLVLQSFPLLLNQWTCSYLHPIITMTVVYI